MMSVFARRLDSLAVALAIALPGALALAPRAAGAVGGPSPGAVSAQTVKLPASPGSVRGLAESATVSGYTGQVQYQVPIELPAAPGGLSPSLSLGYDGSLGNGPLGVGWALSQAGIRRSLRLGVPSYDARDELELIGVAGEGQLVALASGELRVERLGNGYTGRAVDGGFELVDPDGKVYRFGTTAAGRKASGAQVAAWYLEEVRDVAGQTIRYAYVQDRGEVYLDAIAWGPTVAGAPAFRAQLVYETRGDAVVSYRTGFRVESARRLTEIRVSSFGAVQRVTRLTYEEAFALTRLHGATVTSADGQDALPPVTFTYASPETGTVTAIAELGGWTLNAQGTSLFDVDGDGAMDLLRLAPTGHSYRKNLGGRFDVPRPVGGAPGASLDQARLLDLTGDSGAELVWQQGSQWSVFQLTGGDASSRSWSAIGAWGGAQNVSLGSVAVADLNGDYRMDVVSVSGTSIQVRFGTETGLGAPVLRSAIDPARGFIAPGNSATSFPDINGDGLADAVYLSSTAMFLYLGKGNGQFEKLLDLPYPWTGTVAISQIRLGDLNRDGLLDIAVVRAGDVAWYRGLANGAVDPAPVLLSRPAGTDATVVVALADANGNGSEDIVWSSPAGMWILDFAGATSAGMLVAIDNGMGQRQRFEYQASAQLAFAASDAGAPWTAAMPVSIPVSIKSRLELSSGEPPRSSRLDVRDGIYDRIERRFVGFRESILTRPDPADGAPPDQIIRHTQRYADGLGMDRALRGQVISERIEDGTGKLFRATTHDAAAVGVAGLPSDDARLLRSIIRSTTTLHHDGQATPITTRVEFTYDAEARKIEERSLGRTDLVGDESLKRWRYTDGRSARGVRDRACETTQLAIAADGSETVIAREQTLYGDDQQVAALCDASTGWQRVARGYLAGEARWVDRKLTAYDAVGNPVQTRENGVTRDLEYDVARLHVTAEVIAPRPGKTLRWEAAWDNVLGVPTAIRDATGVAMQLTYDGLGRVVATAQGGAAAHSVERYHVAGPRPYLEHLEYDGDSAAVVALPSVWTPASRWRHRVDVFDSAGEPLFRATRLDVDRWLVADLRRRDALGRTVAISDAFEWQGALAGLPAAALPAAVPLRTTAYDALDRPIARTLSTGAVDHYAYRAFETTVTTDGLAPVVTRLDGEGRVLRTERVVAGVTESVDATYDASGRITSMLVAGAASGPTALHRFTYDTLGRLTFATDPDIGDRHLGYDDGDHLVSHSNGANQTVSYTYDGAGRLATMLGSDGAQYSYHYDDPLDGAAFSNAAGRLAWVEEPTGRVELGYDALGRASRARRSVHGRVADERTTLSPSGLVLRTAYDDGLVLDHQYDAAGRPVALGDLWRVTSQDAAGRVLGEQFGNGVAQSYQRDTLGQPTGIQVVSPAAALYQAAVHYNAFGAVTDVADSDGRGLDHTASYSFDGGGRILQAILGQGAAQLRFAYQYDGLQNMIRREAHGAASLALLTGTYRYGEPTATGPRGPRQLTSIVPDVAGAITTSFAYDAAGRTIQHGARALDYNGFDQLVRVTGVASGDGTVEYAYGYDGQRVSTIDPQGVEQVWFSPTVSQAADGTRDYYLRAGDRLIARLTRSASSPLAAARTGAIHAGVAVGRAISLVLWGACIALLAYVLSLPRRRSRAACAALALSAVVVASCSPAAVIESSALATTTRTLYYHQTLGAGATLSTRSDGTVFEERRTEPFGAAIDAYRDLAGGGHETVAVDYARDPSNALNKVSDPATGWSDHGARWLVPETGRWLTPDPPVKAPDPRLMVQPWALHPYQYVHQNPVLYWDPDGKQPAPTGETVGSMIRSAVGLTRIIVGQGITATGSAADIRAWDHMLIEAWASSATARRVISEIGNDNDASHAITVKLGRSQAHVLVDDFASKDVDLDDLAQFPVTPSAAHPNEMTRGEQIVHVLAERRSAILSANPNDMGPAHLAATGVHNQLRGELGQSPELGAGLTPRANGNTIGTTVYKDGTFQDIEVNPNGDIVKVTKP